MDGRNTDPQHYKEPLRRDKRKRLQLYLARDRKNPHVGRGSFARAFTVGRTRRLHRRRWLVG